MVCNIAGQISVEKVRETNFVKKIDGKGTTCPA